MISADSIEETGENDETCEDDKVDEFEKCVWVPGGIKVRLRLPRNFCQPKSTLTF
jgi:hypothetical protein